MVLSAWELENVGFTYPGQQVPALRQISLRFPPAGITAITGPNGSGKTTLTKLMIGVLQPLPGKVRLMGRSLKDYSLAQIGRHVGYVFQNPSQQLFCATVEEEVAFGLVHMGLRPEEVRDRVDTYLRYFELEQYRKVFPLHLSRGEQRRLVIAAAAALEPQWIVLDEPTTGLDPCRKVLLGGYLQKAAALKKGVIFVSHDEKFVARYADRIVVLGQGFVVEDKLKEAIREDPS